MSPGEAAARTDGPLGPDATDGYTALAAAPELADPKVAEIFEKRKDPAAEKSHKELMAEAEGLRLDSLGYKYSEGGFGAAMLSLINPVPGIVDGWDRLTGENLYSSGEGVVASIQSGLDRFRGILKILSTVADWVSIAALIVAPIAALFGGVPGAVALKISIVSGLIGAGIKALDALVGVVQLVINVARARSTDDPVERARLCQQMKAESGMFTDSLTGAVVDGVASLAGGAGKAAVKGATSVGKVGLKGAMKSAARKALFKGRAAARLARIKAKAARKLASRLKLASPAALKRLARMKIRAKIPVAMSKIPLTKGWTEAKRALYKKELNEKLAAMASHGLKRHSPSAWVKAKSTAGQMSKHGAKALGVDSPKGVAKKGIEKGMGSEKAVKGGSPSAPGPGDGPNIGLTYTKVAYWPSVLGEMGVVRKDIHSAQKRMKGEYDKAAKDAGDKRAFIIGIKGEPSKVGTRLRMVGGKQKAAAEAAQQKAHEASETSEQARQKQDDAKGKVDEVKKGADDVGEEAGNAEDKVKAEADSKKGDESWWDKAKAAARSLYDATLGKVFKGLGKVKAKIGKVVLEVALAAAGLTSDDMDLAGMKTKADTDAATDESTKGEAEETSKKADKYDQEIAAAKKGASDQEAAAMQAMVDSGDYLDALDAYDQALAQEQDHGANYVSDATDAVAAVADGPLVTEAAIEPIVNGAAWISDQVTSLPASVETAGNDAVASLVTSIDDQSGDSGLVAGWGGQLTGDWVGAAQEFGALTAKRAASIASTAQQLVGTDWFIVVDETLAPQLEELAADIEWFADVAAVNIHEFLSSLAGVFSTVGGGDADEPAGEPATTPADAEPPDDGDAADQAPVPAAGAE